MFLFLKIVPYFVLRMHCLLLPLSGLRNGKLQEPELKKQKNCLETTIFKTDKQFQQQLSLYSAFRKDKTADFFTTALPRLSKPLATQLTCKIWPVLSCSSPPLPSCPSPTLANFRPETILWLTPPQWNFIKLKWPSFSESIWLTSSGQCLPCLAHF